jgi:rRNA maturation endonuclease Nob1
VRRPIVKEDAEDLELVDAVKEEKEEKEGDSDVDVEIVPLVVTDPEEIVPVVIVVVLEGDLSLEQVRKDLGFQSPNSDVSSKKASSNDWRRSTFTLFPLRSIKS